MNIAQSTLSLASLLDCAAKKAVPSAPGVEVEVFHVKPDEEAEIWDRVIGEVDNPHQFVFSEYAGAPPVLARDGRRYRKVFYNHANEEPTTVTYASSHYQLQPGTVVMQGRRIGQTHGPESALFTLFMCDEGNPMKLPPYRRELLDPREEAAACEPGRD